MFSNKRRIENIEHELCDDDLITNTSELSENKIENCKSELSISKDGEIDSIYEFTFDPNEETPPPLKQTALRKKAKAKPKVIFVNNNYETNVLKKLLTLKSSFKKRNNLDADDKENLSNNCPEPVPKEIDLKLISPEQRNGSPKENQKSTLRESLPRRDGLFKDISIENTPKATKQKHSKASPWRADFEAITLLQNNETNNLNKTPLPCSKTKLSLSSQDVNSTTVESTEPKLKQPRLTDFIKISSQTNILPNESLSNKNISFNSNMETAPIELKKTNEMVKAVEPDSSGYLFEDIEVVPSVKPCRRSYCKKEIPSPTVAARRPRANDSKLLDLSEELSAIETANKKAERKQAKRNEQQVQLSKQEEAEVNAWAEAFNSMCEDVEDFPLVVE